ncbi:hypothetical protein GCM10011519_05250 [Marmoricola endophyticus]|uniref:PPIase cyclophilin-type domain-containing protein n=1 Tax=Marmoricola endophyticus TaxID=2040280 RepID=A0A917BD37_9ACTN|nr:peptidylprolyl isomerase [Marmoricola endophyticus]GGF34756.1 hypothetical protein GCM10011519_05250 [Marmoricola endophyticus]
MTVKTVPALALALAAAMLSTACSSEQSDAGSAPSSSSASPGKGGCAYVDSGQEAAKPVQKPPAEPTEKGDVPVDIATNFGDLSATLDGKTAPCAVNSFLSLARQGWYDDTSCHRITSDSRGFHVLQCGDPTGTGTGDPGYRFAEEVDADTSYEPGTIAMAKTTQPDTTGAQLFIVYDTTQLPAQYTVLGTLTPAGLAVAKKAAAAAVKGKPDGYDGPPATAVTVTGVTRG